MLRRPPRSTLFPSPPPIRSEHHGPARPCAQDDVRIAPADIDVSRRERDRLGHLAHGERADLVEAARQRPREGDRKSTRLNSSHANISYAVFCLQKKKKNAQK